MKIKVPHTLALLFFMMVLGWFLTYLLPSGRFDTNQVHGKEEVIAGTYHNIDKKYLEPWELFTVLPRAFADSQAIIFFVFIIGGALSVIKHTGVIDAVLGKLLNKFGSKPQILIFTGVLIFLLLLALAAGGLYYAVMEIFMFVSSTIIKGTF